MRGSPLAVPGATLGGVETKPVSVSKTSPERPLAGPTSGSRFGLADLRRLWAAARLVWPGSGPKGVYYRCRFVARGLLVRDHLTPFLRPGDRGLGRLVAARPDTVGALEWPYICLDWGPLERLARIRDHYDAVASGPPLLDLPVDEERELVNLGDVVPGLRLVLDQVKYFQREGELVLNLFGGDTRLFSLAFSLRLEPELVAYVGAIQGRNLEGVLDTYRELTGALHGMRPRDFLVEVFCLFCRAAGVTRILAVSDASRQHRSSYFGPAKEIKQDYDAIWRERGGVPAGPSFFALPVGGTRREMGEIPSKKRSMYRRRYELLDRIEVRIGEALQ